MRSNHCEIESQEPTRTMIPMDIPGYRFDATTNRFYAIDPSPAVRASQSSARRGESSAEEGRGKQEAIATTRKSSRSFDPKWAVQRACRNVKVERDDGIPIPLSNLRCSPSAPWVLAGVDEQRRVWTREVGREAWHTVETGDQPLGGGAAPNLGAYRLGSFYDSVLEWHPSEPVMLFAGGRENEEYVQSIRVSESTDQPAVGVVHRLSSQPTCGLFRHAGCKAFVFTTRRRKGYEVDLESTSWVDIPKFDSDVLSCSLMNDDVSVLVGLRNGTIRLWDSRTRDSQQAFEYNFGAPVVMLRTVSDRDNALYVHAPRGLQADSSALMDLRRPNSPLAYFDLRARLSSKMACFAQGDPHIGEMLFARDDRDGLIRVFDMASASVLTSVETSIPGDSLSMEVVGKCESSLLLLVATTTGLLKYQSSID